MDHHSQNHEIKSSIIKHKLLVSHEFNKWFYSYYLHNFYDENVRSGLYVIRPATFKECEFFFEKDFIDGVKNNDEIHDEYCPVVCIDNSHDIISVPILTISISSNEKMNDQYAEYKIPTIKEWFKSEESILRCKVCHIPSLEEFCCDLHSQIYDQRDTMKKQCDAFNLEVFKKGLII